MIEKTIAEMNWKMTTELEDLQGWNSEHHFLTSSIKQLLPKVIVEAGVWKGGSIIHMAKVCKEIGISPKIYAIDTWLACDILRTVPEWVPSLKMNNNRPEYWRTFYDNAIRAGVDDLITPLHMDTRSGLRYLRRLGIKIDLFHHDASHYSPDVYDDLIEADFIMNTGGHIIVDDYIVDDKRFPHPCDFSGVVSDVNRYANFVERPIDIVQPKARIVL